MCADDISLDGPQRVLNNPDVKLLLPLVLLTAFCATAQADLPAVEATNAVRRELPWLLITEADLAITTPTPVRQTIGLVETFFSTPLAFPVSASEWADIVEPADDLGPLFVLSDNLLGKSVAVDPETIAWEPPEPVPPSARTAIKKLVAAISAGQPFLNRAVRSVSPEDRARAAEVRRCAESLGAQVLDPRQLEAGLPWQRATAQMLRESDAVVGLLSSDFPSPWLAEEMAQAVKLRKPLLLLRGAQVEPRTLGLPSGTYSTAAADLDDAALVAASSRSAAAVL